MFLHYHIRLCLLRMKVRKKESGKVFSPLMWLEIKSYNGITLTHIVRERNTKTVEIRGKIKVYVREDEGTSFGRLERELWVEGGSALRKFFCPNHTYIIMVEGKISDRSQTCCCITIVYVDWWNECTGVDGCQNWWRSGEWSVIYTESIREELQLRNSLKERVWELLWDLKQGSCLISYTSEVKKEKEKQN